MSDLEKLRSEQLSDPEFREYYFDMQADANLSKAIIGARIEKGLTQKELADITGIPQANISRIESCEANPSLKTLKRLAKGLNMQLQISFKPLEETQKVAP